MSILLIIYIVIVFILTFGIRAILLVEKIEKPSLLVIFIFSVFWPLILSIYILKFIYENIKSAILRI